MSRVQAIGLAAACLLGCSEAADLYVDLRTDYRAGVDFSIVQLRSGERTLGFVRVTADTDPLAPSRIARIAPSDVDVPADFEMELLDTGGAVVARRTVRIARFPARALTLTVLITRGCAGVRCPVDGEPARTECLLGQCVAPECVDPVACASPQCSADADCALDGPSCARGRCIDGACLAVPEPEVCPSPLTCSVASGRCVLAPGPLGTAPDGGSVLNELCEPEEYAGHSYSFCLALVLDHARARRLCGQRGMRLLRLDDAAESAFIAQRVAAEHPDEWEVALDGSDAAVEGDWRWSDGDLFWRGAAEGEAQGLYVEWNSAEPTDEGGEDCAKLRVSPGWVDWVDYPCADRLAVVCESE